MTGVLAFLLRFRTCPSILSPALWSGLSWGVRVAVHGIEPFDADVDDTRLVGFGRDGEGLVVLFANPLEPSPDQPDLQGPAVGPEPGQDTAPEQGVEALGLVGVGDGQEDDDGELGRAAPVVSPFRAGRGMIPETERRVPERRTRREELVVDVDASVAVRVSLPPDQAAQPSSRSLDSLRSSRTRVCAASATLASDRRSWRPKLELSRQSPS